jgi:PadR family transcriptional regulator PadR
MELERWKTQLRKGVLDLCILNFLGSHEYYGYDLVQEMKEIDGLQMRQGMIYPILARLEEDGLVTSEGRPSDAGPPRKYFIITQTGREAAQQMNRHWQMIEAAVRMACDAGRGNTHGE